MLVFPGRLMTSALGENLFADASAYWPFSTSLSLVGSPGPTLTFTRASASVDFNPNDLSGSPIKDFATNVPILLPALGLGIWESRTNPVLWGRDLSNAAWIKTNMSAVKNAVGANGDANGATTVTATAASATILQTVTATSAARAGQAFVKRSVGTGLVEMTLNGGTNWVDITASLSTTIWFNPKILLTLANPQIGFRITTSGDAIIVDYVDAQAGAFATPPIPTTTIAVTRAADVCSTSDVSWLNQSEGTIFAKAIVQRSDSTALNIGLFDVNDGGGSNQIRLDYSVNNKRIQLVTTNSGGNNGFSTAGTVTPGQVFKAAGSYVQDNVVLAFDGTLGTADTTADIPLANTLTQSKIGAAAGLQLFTGHISEIAYWNVVKPDSFLTSITS